MCTLAAFSIPAACRIFAVGLLLAANFASVASSTAPQAAGRIPQPVIESARGDSCVEDPAFMRRNHMELLKHQRDDTVHDGVRTAKYSLKACIACHAGQTTNSVTAASTNFCQSCHAYAAVKIDCFECHSSKPAPTVAASQSPQARPKQSTVAPSLPGIAVQKQGKP